ncbi:zinc finger motif, C2HC5-type protein, partial [Cardiosporidium cionae]
ISINEKKGEKSLEIDERKAAEDTHCISIQQPWATLILEGIKRVEGREWPTLHRGRLWIHAAAKPLDELTQFTAESLYHSVAIEQSVDLASLTYPVSTLLGSITLETCLSYDQYTQSDYPIDASLFSDMIPSKFYFILSHPLKLKHPVMMRGNVKLWKLEKSLVLSCLEDFI